MNCCHNTLSTPDSKLFKTTMAAVLIALWSCLLPAVASTDKTIEPFPQEPITMDNDEISRVITEIHQSRILLQKIIMNYHLFSVRGSDPVYNKAIETHTKTFAVLQSSLSKTLNKNQISDSSSLQSNWKSFNKLLSNNRSRLKKKRSVNAQLMDNMMASAELLMTDLVNISADISNIYHYETKPSIVKTRELSIIMQQLATHYAGRSSSSFGVSQKAQENEKTIDVLAKEFAGKLAELAQHKENNEEIKALFNRVNTKWRFIEKPLENYTESSIPFLITRYSDHIITVLQKIVLLYQ